MKKLIKTLAIISGVLLMASCASNPAENSTNESAAETTQTKKASNNPFKIEDDRFAELMEKSIVTTGNNYRLKTVLEKLKAGDEVYVAALGGSVTEGAGPANYTDGYAYQFNRKLVKAYTPNNGANVHFDGAGLSGTPSTLGLVRYESDVVEVLGHKPDLLIIEFAVNDDNSEKTTRCFEALVRNALEQNSETAVIVLDSAATYGNTANSQKPVVEFYKVPQIDVLPVVKDCIAKGDFKQTDYYTDVVHPTKTGHELQADCIMALLAKVDAAEKDAAVAVPEGWCKAKPLTNFTRILGDDDNVKINSGSFHSKDATTQSLKKTNKGDFPNNWYHESGSDSFTMNINCKALVFVYKEQGSWLNVAFGKADVYVDGKLVATYDGGKQGGWCNCVPNIIIDEETAADHTVEVKMASGDEKKGFTIVAMGYSK